MALLQHTRFLGMNITSVPPWNELGLVDIDPSPVPLPAASERIGYLDSAATWDFAPPPHVTVHIVTGQYLIV